MSINCSLILISTIIFKANQINNNNVLIVELMQSVTLELSPGKLTALVGPSGGGKSSCVSLLQRFYEPKEGEMFLDGEPLYRYKHQYLHKKARNHTQTFTIM